MKLKSRVKCLSGFIKNPIVTFGFGSIIVMLADTWFDVSTTDFVSAVANVAMAFSAVYALYEARKYIFKKASEDGYNIAKTLLYENLLHTAIFNGLVSNMRVIINNLQLYSDIEAAFKGRDVEQRIQFEKNRIIVLSNICSQLETTLNEKVYVLNQSIQMNITRLYFSGGDFSKTEYGFLLKSHFENFRLFTLSLERSVIELKNYLAIFYLHRYDHIYDATRISIPIHSGEFWRELDELQKKFTKVSDDFNEIKEGMNTIVTGRRDIFEYFIF